MENETQSNKEYKVIIKPSVARKLIHAGNQVIDIKPNKNNPVEATVFVFRNDDKFKDDLRKIIKS